jgi:hypothetical protein
MNKTKISYYEILEWRLDPEDNDIIIKKGGYNGGY